MPFNRSRSGASLLALLLLLHAAFGLVHLCCLGGSETMASREAHATTHEGLGHTDRSGHAAEESGAMSGHHGSDSDEPSPCEGVCGLCCSSLDGPALATIRVVALRVPSGAGRGEGLRPAGPPRASAPDFLLPPSTAPPGSSTPTA